MTLDEFLKRLKKESNTIEDLKKGNYYSYLDAFYKMIAYDGERLNKKHDLLITPYLQYISKNKTDNFKAGLSKTEMEEIIESLKMDIDCMIFRIEQKN